MLYRTTEIGICKFGFCKFIAHMYLIKIKIISDSTKGTKANKITTEFGGKWKYCNNLCNNI